MGAARRGGPALASSNAAAVVINVAEMAQKVLGKSYEVDLAMLELARASSGAAARTRL